MVARTADRRIGALHAEDTRETNHSAHPVRLGCGCSPQARRRAAALRQHHSPGLCRLSSSLHGWPTLLQLTGGCKRWAGHREDELLAAVCFGRSGSSGGGLFRSPKREGRRASEWRSMLSASPGFPARGPASGRQLERRIFPNVQISLPQAAPAVVCFWNSFSFSAFWSGGPRRVLTASLAPGARFASLGMEACVRGIVLGE